MPPHQTRLKLVSSQPKKRREKHWYASHSKSPQSSTISTLCQQLEQVQRVNPGVVALVGLTVAKALAGARAVASRRTLCAAFLTLFS